MDLFIFDTVLILLIVSIVTSSVLQKLNIPVIVGYIAVGVILGPYSLSILANNADIMGLAEFGLVFLMFNIGLEFSFKKLMRLKKTVFLFGGLEVVIATIATTLIGVYLSLTLAQALVLGTIVAMSSTAIVLKQLTSQRTLGTPQGQSCLGILLFQDLAVIPVLILIPNLETDGVHLAIDLTWALGNTVLAVLLILLIGRFVLRPAFSAISRMKNLEVFTLCALFVTLASAWLTHELGLSMTLGAFVAGMMLGETEFRHQIESDIRPFKDVLVGFFFIAIGSQFNFIEVAQFWPWILTLLLALVIFKMLLITGLGRLLGNSLRSSILTALNLSHGGEFGFAILTIAMSHQILPQDYGQVILAALLMSMLIAPFMISHSDKLSRILTFKKSVNPVLNANTFELELVNHIVIGGFGRVGQGVANFLKQTQIPYIAFDHDLNTVQRARKSGEPIILADLTSHQIFEKANLARASVLVLSFNNCEANAKIVRQIRLMYPSVKILVRAHGDKEALYLYKCGATEVIPEVFEGSLTMAGEVMKIMQVEQAKINQLLEIRRKEQRIEVKEGE